VNNTESNNSEINEAGTDDGGSVRHRALARLGGLVGNWTEHVHIPGVLAGQMSFEWVLDAQFLLQRSTIPGTEFPDSIGIIAVAEDGDAGDAGRFVQHYFDARGVSRHYAMALDERTWTLLRDQPDGTPLHFLQRFTGTFADNGTTISAVWERSDDGRRWRTDFALTYTRILPTPAIAQAHDRSDIP